MFNETCRYYSGPNSSQCFALISLNQFRKIPGDESTLPCFVSSDNPNPKKVCSLFELPTPEEVAEAGKITKSDREKIPLIAILLRDIKRKFTADSGEEKCPICGGTLSWVILNSKRKFHISCSTRNCVDYTEIPDPNF